MIIRVITLQDRVCNKRFVAPRYCCVGQVASSEARNETSEDVRAGEERSPAQQTGPTGTNDDDKVDSLKLLHQGNIYKYNPSFLCVCVMMNMLLEAGRCFLI